MTHGECRAFMYVCCNYFGEFRCINTASFNGVLFLFLFLFMYLYDRLINIVTSSYDFKIKGLL